MTYRIVSTELLHIINSIADAYVKLWVDASPTQTSRTTWNSLTPDWNESFLFRLNSPPNTLHFQVWDRDPNSDQFVCTVINTYNVITLDIY